MDAEPKPQPKTKEKIQEEIREAEARNRKRDEGIAELEGRIKKAESDLANLDLAPTAKEARKGSKAKKAEGKAGEIAALKETIRRNEERKQEILRKLAQIKAEPAGAKQKTREEETEGPAGEEPTPTKSDNLEIELSHARERLKKLSSWRLLAKKRERKEIARLEEELMAEDEIANPFKFFLLGKMSAEIQKKLELSYRKAKFALFEDVNKKLGKSGEKAAEVWRINNYDRNSPYPVVNFTPVGFSLHLINPQEVKSLGDAKAKFGLTDQNGKKVAGIIDNHQRGMILLKEKSEAYLSEIKKEFEGQAIKS